MADECPYCGGPLTNICVLDQALLEMPLVETPWWDDVPARLRNACHSDRIFTVADLVEKTELYFLRMPKVGRTSVNGLKQVLAEYGLSLAFNTSDRQQLQRRDAALRGWEGRRTRELQD